MSQIKSNKSLQSGAKNRLFRKVRKRKKTTDEKTGSVHPLIHLQQTIGNQAVGRFIQAQVKVGKPGDKYEQEADHVAEKVMQMPDSQVQRQAEEEKELRKQPADEKKEEKLQLQPEKKDEEELQRQSQEEKKEELRKQPAEEKKEESLQRQPEKEDEEKLQRQPQEEKKEELRKQPAEEKKEELRTQPAEKEEELKQQPEDEKKEETVASKEINGHTPTVSSKVQANIQNMRGSGKPLPNSVRNFFEPRFGYDFSQVRVHHDTQAAETAQGVKAKAFTVGQNVVFGKGQYAPETSKGRRLMAHELTHVIQQESDISTLTTRSKKLNRIGEPVIQGGFLGKIWGGIKKAAKWVGKGIKKGASAVWKSLKKIGNFSWRAIKAIGKWGWNVLKSAGAWVWDLVTEAPTRIWHLLKHVGSGIVGVISWLWDGIKAGLGHIWTGVKGVLHWAGEGITGLFSWIWQGLRGGAKWAWKLLNGDFSGFWEGIGGFFSWLGKGVVQLAKWGWEGLKAAGIWAWQGIKGVGKWIWNGFLSAAAWVGRLIAKLLDLVGFGEIMDLLWQIIKFNTRTMTSTEINEAKKVFANSINYWQVRIDEYSLISWLGSLFQGGGGMGVVTFHTINFNKKINASPGNPDMAWLIHELTHVSQMEHVGMQYIGEALHALATTGYDYTLDKLHFRDYNREQQARIAEHYYYVLCGNGLPHPYNTYSQNDFEKPYINELRAGNL